MWGLAGRVDQNVDLPSPFHHERLSGYSRWSNSENRAQLLSMLSYGGYGRGMHVGHLLEPECCVGYGPAIHKAVKMNNDVNQPWLFPSEVEWVSIMGQDGRPLPAIAEAFSEIDYPCVGISYVNSASADFRWALNNLNFPNEYEGPYDWDPNAFTLNISGLTILGLAPIWSVVPLHEDNQIMLKDTVNTIQYSTDLELVNECYCTLDYAECDEDCAYANDYTKECTCQRAQKLLDQIMELYANPIVVEKYMHPELLEIWEYAKEQNKLGWSVIDQAVQQGETWAYYWQRQQSPYPDSTGQVPEVQQGLTA